VSWRQSASGRGATIAVAILSVLVMAFSLSLSAPVLAGDDPETAVQAEYILGPGDAISISVFGDEQLTVTALIGPDGIISIPLAGSVRVSGRTVDEIRADIAHALSAYIKSPDVTVTVVEYRKVRIVVVGEVAHPGIYEAPKGAGAVVAIAAAGGLTELADADSIVAMDGLTRAVDYSAVVEGRAVDAPLGDGAVVHVPREVRQILVLGDVVKPGSYPAPKGGDMRLLDAVAAAGGVAGDARRAQVVWNGMRDGAQGNLSASLGELIDAPGAESNIILASGDVIFVSEAPQQASIIGEVACPGVYPVGADTTLLDLIAAAGGPSERADLGNVKVYAEGNTEDGAAFDLAERDLAFTGDVKANPKVAPGAVIVIPSAYLRVQVAGYVGNPGQIELERGATALDAIVAAGGVRQDGDGSRVSLTRRSDELSEVRQIDIEGILSGHVPHSEAPGLVDGDVLFVPGALERMTLLGEVRRPGSYSIEPGSTLMDVMAAAGGPTEWADMGAVRVYEGGNVEDAKTFELADDRLVFEGSIKANPLARAGQVVVVPSTAIRVVATGHVNRPGTLTLVRGATVLDAIAAAGGIRADGDGARVILTRADGEDTRSMEIDIEGISRGEAGSAPVLSDGDAIYVPQALAQVAVLGEVGRPGVYRVERGSTLMDVIAAAGGPTERADMGAVRVYEGENVEDAKTFELADDRLVFEGSIKANPLACAGQVVVVPSTAIQVVATGHVSRPGTLALVRGATVLDAIAAAGGIRADGDGARVILTRADGEDTRSMEIDIEGISRGEAGSAPVLSDGDAIYVPQALAQVAVLGEVGRPGVYRVERGATLMDVLASAGGPTDRADLSQVKMYEGGEAGSGVSLEIADDSLVYTGDILDNPKVAAGNVIVVPAGTIKVHVAGRVVRPGSYVLRKGAGVLEAVVAAGGTSASADGSRAILTAQSDGEVRAMEVDVDSILAGKEKDLTLSDGDSLFVPEATAQVVILGEVMRPGAYRLPQGARLLDAIGVAGGPSARASLEKVSIYSGGDSSLKSDVVLGSGRAVYEGDARENPYLGPDDVVVVGSRAISVSVAGGVARPGVYELAQGARILDAISAAGGVAASGKKVVTHARHDDGSAVSDIDLDAIGEDPMCEANAHLADGDVLYVPEARRSVAVLGAVARPGVYAVDDTPTLLEALAASGGPKQDADLSQVRVYTGVPGSFVDLSLTDREPVYLGDVEEDPAIEAGSVVVVPSSAIHVYVAGRVARPGMVELIEGATCLDAIAAAGGVTSQGDGSRIALARKGQEMSEIDIEAAIRGEAEDVALLDGDALFVPEVEPGQVVVLGEVARPGAYRLPDGAKLLDAIGAAGGATDRAMLEEISIFSEGLDGKPRYVSIREGDSIGASRNPEVLPGDVIVVPCGTVKVNVIGSAARPGMYELPQGARILDALSAAGGIGSQGDGSHVICSSAPGPVDVKALVADPSGAGNVLLSSGDVIYVPEAKRQIAVLGEVARPGVYMLAAEATLMDALAAAGGPQKHAALDGVRVYEGSDVEGGASLDIADEKLLYAGDVKANPKLSAGQIVVVPSGAIHVQVAGSVSRPGGFELGRGATIIEAVTAAGGIRADGDGAGVVVTRQGAGAHIVDVDEAMAGREEPMALIDGDVIYVPQRSGEVVVLGEVSRPGGYSLPRGAKLLDAIAVAGGPTQKAALEDVTIYKGGVIAEGMDAPIGAGKVLFSGKVTENPEVRPGDVVHVESRLISVSVFGRVSRPGTMELPRGARVLDAVGAAGGILADGDHTQISLTRSGAEGPADSIDLDKVLRDPGDGANRPLSDGDLIYVPQVSRQVAVMGEVVRPGVYQYAQDMTLMDVLATAGGPTRMADLEQVRVYRGEDVDDALTLSVADDRLRYVGDLKSNPRVRPGDIVMIPSGAIRVQVLGRVARTGEVEVRKGATVLDAISAAGGISASGDGSRVVLTREGAESREIDVDALLAGGGSGFEVAYGDVLFVPEANRKVAVMGSVLRPGLYDFKPGMRLVDVLAMAGGTTATANLSKVMVYSGDEAAEIALGGSPSKGEYIDPTKGNNPALAFGDIVIVPPAKTINWSQISAMLTIMNQLMNIITRY
jgi:protein involved in polysaccharide export with SLBB domain